MKKKKINLALQGGGAHGAFAWGILDRFLERDIFIIDGISATSAGSMNAVVLAQGMTEGGPEKARELLKQFWHAMSDYGKIFNVTQETPLDFILGPYLKTPINFLFFSTLVDLFSPYQFNPYNLHPIRDVLKSIINIEEIRQQKEIKLFICATNVKTCKIHIFDNQELSIEAILASACLPKLFQAVEVDGEYYWDGGFLGNPAIYPLIYHTKTKDIIILHLCPIHEPKVPQSVPEIDTRLREISFNSSLMREMRAIAFVSDLIEKKCINKKKLPDLKEIYLHCLRGDQALQSFSHATLFSPDWNFLLHLFDLGRKAADVWIENNYNFIGKKTTVDFKEWL